MHRISTVIPLAAPLLSLVLASCATDDGATDETMGDLPAGDTVASVEVDRYVGLWYEIASIPQGFQRSCAGTTATYEAIEGDPEADIRVINRCFAGGLDGEEFEIVGTARVVDPATNAKLEVDFGFARSPYWIVDLGEAPADQPYPWAVVSTPERESLWILSRTPDIGFDRLDALLERLETRGFEPERLELTDQPMQ